MNLKPIHYKRCKCHKYLCFGQDDENQVHTVHCVVTREALSRDQTYVATMDSQDEVVQKPQDAVQKGVKLYD
jgi:hypothetical protein